MDGQQKQTRSERVRLLDGELKKLFPDAKIALKYSNPWELLVAVVLSAQCTDVAVNRCTEKLFPKYPYFEDYLKADPEAFEKDISSITFYHNKAKNLLAAAQKVQKEFGGQVHQTMAELITLPGVARKTANIIQGNAFGVVEGIAVDTHVRRFALKFELADRDDPVKIERDLMEILPQEEWFAFTYRVIEYGRQVCKAKKHDCFGHPLTKLYPQASEIWP
jgi:endonuclease-3